MDRYQYRSDPRVAARDAGLRRIYQLTRWVGFGALGAVGLVAAYAANANPGRSTSSPYATSGTGGAARSLAAQTVPQAAAVPELSTGGGSLTPPASPPAPVTAPAPVTPAPVVSGGS